MFEKLTCVSDLQLQRTDYLRRMDRLLVVASVLVALCFLESVDSSAYDKIVSHSRIRARKEG